MSSSSAPISTVGAGVGVGRSVGVGVIVRLGVTVGVSVAVGACVGVIDGAGVLVGVRVAVGVLVGVGVQVGTAVRGGGSVSSACAGVTDGSSASVGTAAAGLPLPWQAAQTSRHAIANQREKGAMPITISCIHTGPDPKIDMRAGNSVIISMIRRSPPAAVAHA
jgi:hypothetical protein